MGWESRSYGQSYGEGGFRRAVRRIFGEGENPLTWSLPLYKAWGIRVRVHLIFVILILVELISAIPGNRIGFIFVAFGIAALFVLVLLHEYGHCIACRWEGGTADQILMWPLGGLAYCQPAPGWRADLVTTLGGPGVNVLLAPVFALALRAVLPGSVAWDSIFFNPFDPGRVIAGLHLADGSQPLWLVGLWWLYYMNAILLMFNMLVPMYPMDAGRVLYAILWSRYGQRKAMAAAANVGLVVAVILVVWGFSGDSTRLAMVGLFGGVTCWMEKQRLKMTGDPMLGDYDFSRGYQSLPDEEEVATVSARARKAAEKRRREEERDQAELDRILAKIASEGMGSLTAAEKKWLQRATEKRRQN